MQSKLNFLHFCDSAFINAENRNLNLIGIFDTILSANFPAIHPKFSVVINVTAEEGIHIITLVIKQESTEIAKIEKTFSGVQHLWIHNFIGFKFPNEGRYEIQVYVDKELVGAKELFLKKIA